MKILRAIDIAPDAHLSEPIERGWHSRGNRAYIVRDSVTNSVILASTLTALAEYLNAECARTQLERVSVRGLYEAADKRNGYTGGLHKMRYLVSRCDLSDSHVAFEQARREGVDKATLLTEASVKQRGVDVPVVV